MAGMVQSSGLQGLRRRAVSGSSQDLQLGTRHAIRQACRQTRARQHRTQDARAAVCVEAPAQAQNCFSELQKGQEHLAVLTAQLEAMAPGASGVLEVADVVAGLHEVRARLERVAEGLRVTEKEPCNDASSSSSSSSEDECMDEAAVSLMEAKRAKKEVKMLEKAAKKQAKEREKDAKRQAKAARRAEEALTVAIPSDPLRCEESREQVTPILAAAAAFSEPAAAAPGPLAEAPARGALVLRTMRGDLVLDGAVGQGGQSAPAVQVEVCTGKACAKRGSAAVLAGLSAALAGDAGVDVTGCKCMDQCKKGPNLRVRVANETPVIATGVPPSDAARAVSRIA